MASYLTEDEVRESIKREIRERYNGSQKDFAAARRLSPQFVNDVLRGRRHPVRRIGYCRVVVYRPVA